MKILKYGLSLHHVLWLGQGQWLLTPQFLFFFLSLSFFPKLRVNPEKGCMYVCALTVNLCNQHKEVS